MAGRTLPPLSLLIPFWLVRSMVSWRETFAVWPALLVIGGTFAATQYAWSNFVGVDLVDIVSSVSSLLAGVLILAVWKPCQEWRFPHEREADALGTNAAPTEPLTPRRVARAWMPFALLTVSVLVWGLPPVKAWMDAKTPHQLPGVGPSFALSWKWEVPRLHRAVVTGPEISGRGNLSIAALTPETHGEKAEIDLVPVSSTGTAVFLAAVLGGLFLGVGPIGLAKILFGTVWRLRGALAAILCMLALGYVTKYSGMDAVLGLAFTRTGPWLYPIFGTFLGWLGVALTGSDTSSNVLFGNLQRITASKLGLNPILMASANSTGGVMGKMIDAQSIVVAAAATGEAGQEGRILRAVLGHSLALAGLVGALVWLYAHVWTGIVPAPPAGG
jgi:lactate permease